MSPRCSDSAPRCAATADGDFDGEEGTAARDPRGENGVADVGRLKDSNRLHKSCCDVEMASCMQKKRVGEGGTCQGVHGGWMAQRKGGAKPCWPDNDVMPHADHDQRDDCTTALYHVR